MKSVDGKSLARTMREVFEHPGKAAAVGVGAAVSGREKQISAKNSGSMDRALCDK